MIGIITKSVHFDLFLDHLQRNYKINEIYYIKKCNNNNTCARFLFGVTG